MGDSQNSSQTNTALIIGPGGLRGAYNAGVAVRLGRELGTEWVDGIYASSVGVYMAAFFAADQFHPIEHVWRNLVHGDQLVDISKPLRGRNWLDLEYLVDVLARDNPNTHLDISAAVNSSTDLNFTLTGKTTGSAVFRQPTVKNIYPLMTASCAVPFMHPPVAINGRQYVDGVLSNPLPIDKAFADGYDRLVVIDETPETETADRHAMWWLSWLFSAPLSDAVANYPSRKSGLERKSNSNPHIFVIRPSEDLPMRSFMDTDEARINETFDRGLADAQKNLTRLTNNFLR